MVRYRYDFLPNLSQLVLLSVSAAVSVKFEHKVVERLSWLEGVLSVLDPMVRILSCLNLYKFTDLDAGS